MQLNPSKHPNNNEYNLGVGAQYLRIPSNNSPTSNKLSTSPSRGLEHHYDSNDLALRQKDINAIYPVLLQHKTNKAKSHPINLTPVENEDKENENANVPVTEEQEEYEKDHYFLKKLPIVTDAQEFNSKETKMRGRGEGRDKDISRCRSVEAAYLPLDSVQEDKNEEEPNTFGQRKKLEDLNLGDLNEFNQNDKILLEKRNRRKYSLQSPFNDSIKEEQEHATLPHLPTIFVNYAVPTSNRGSEQNSPSHKLQVDEVDYQEIKLRSREESCCEDIDPIMEETEEKNNKIVEENREFQAAKHKLNEEREFMKKVVRGEIIDENTSNQQRTSVEKEYPYVGSGVIDEVIEEDKNENFVL